MFPRERGILYSDRHPPEEKIPSEQEKNWAFAKSQS